MAQKPLVLKRKPPTRIVRKPMRGQTQLELKPRVRLATRRRRARVYGVIVALLVSGVSVFGVSVLSYSQRLAIQDIRVEGAQALSAAALESTFGSVLEDGKRHFFSRSNIFFFPRHELRSVLLDKLPLLKVVSFSRESLLSQVVTITVVEREPAYVWCADTCYFMDNEGFVFAASQNPTSLLTFRGGLDTTREPIGQVFLLGRLDTIIQLVDGLKRSNFIPEEITVENEKDISVRLHDGFLIKMTYHTTAELISKNLSLVLASEALAEKERFLEYIDLRFGNRVYYKLKGNDMQIDTPL